MAGGVPWSSFHEIETFHLGGKLVWTQDVPRGDETVRSMGEALLRQAKLPRTGQDQPSHLEETYHLSCLEEAESSPAAWKTLRPDQLPEKVMPLPHAELLAGCAVCPRFPASMSCHSWWGGLW